jgi:hypothetical protein
MLRSFVVKYATALTTALFAIIALSGVAMFFHLKGQLVHSMHEWLGLALVAVASLHIWRNWKAMKGYFYRKTVFAPLALVLLIGGGFVYSAASAPKSSDPARQIAAAISRAPLTQIAPMVRQDAEAIANHLRDKGFIVSSTRQSLADIGATNRRDDRETLGAFTDLLKKPD